MNENDNLSCNLWRDICCKFLIHVRIFRFCEDDLQRHYILQFLICRHVFKFWREICNNSCFVICDRVCMLKYNEMLCVVCTWRMHCNLIFFVCFNSNEMFCQLICISFSICCITRKIYIILTRCLYKRFIFFNFWFLSTCSNSESCLHAM